ncbi:MAG: S8 family serine peptidase [Candidatus Competibacteraceae bacterium]|nr:S8 family serine peptidase [Candidatus Competibacteraceae bacterium]
MSKSYAFARPTRLHGAIRSALLASALATSGVLSQVALAEKPDPALYDQDTEQVLVYLQPEIKPDDLAKRYGLKRARTLVSEINAHVFATDSVEAARKILPALRADKTVKAAFNNRRTVMVPFLAPNDPYYYPDASQGHLGQWHLENEYGWPDINAEDAWAQGVTGEGVVIGIVDSGVQPDHEDLSVNPDLSFDFVEYDADSTPCYDRNEDPSDPLSPPVCSSAYHGTAVAGVAAAIGDNGVGVAGVATRAQVAGLRVPIAFSFNPEDPDTVESADSFVDAIHYGAQSIFNVQQKRISIKNHSYGSVEKYVATEALNYALRETAAAGMVHVLAAGNERQDRNTKGGRSSNLDGIAVAALAYDSRYADYSNYGASIFVTAPSKKSAIHHIGITTTDIYGSLGANDGVAGLRSDYDDSFGGTSAAAPQVAGALALVKELRPDMDTRLAKHLLVNSSLPVDIEDNSREGGWTVNAAGCGFNPNYGFGLLQADKLVKLAREGLTISPPTQWNGNSSLGGNVVSPAPPIYGPSEPSNPADGEPIPDAGQPLTRTIKVDDCPAWGCPPLVGGREPLNTLEEVGVTLDIEHSRRGDIEVVLISPSNTASRLARSYTKLPDEMKFENPFAEGIGRIRHTFWSNAFWGEWPEGEWTLQIHDKVTGETGVVNSYNLHLHMGSVTAPAGFPVCENHRRLRAQRPSLPEEGFKP